MKKILWGLALLFLAAGASADGINVPGGPPTGSAGGSLAGTYPNPTVSTNANLTGDVTSVGNATTFTGKTGGALGQIPGSTTNDSANAGNMGEYISTSSLNTTSTVTITNASPGVISWTAHGLTAASVTNFTTTGGLPTGLAVGTNYYVCAGATLLTNSFAVATSVANAIAGTCVNTSSAGSGTQTGISNATLTNNGAFDLGGISLTAGNWIVSCVVNFVFAGTTNYTQTITNISTASGGLSPIYPGGRNIFNIPSSVPGSTEQTTTVQNIRILLSGTTTIFCPSRGSFTLGALNAYGILLAWRPR